MDLIVGHTYKKLSTGIKYVLTEIEREKQRAKGFEVGDRVILTKRWDGGYGYVRATVTSWKEVSVPEREYTVVLDKAGNNPVVSNGELVYARDMELLFDVPMYDPGDC